jgi:MFS family permease
MNDQKPQASAAAPSDAGALPARSVRWGIYGTAFFSLSMVPMASILVPLWLVGLGATPLMIGIAIGVRSLLPLLLSIHGGVLMDRLGPRRVTLAVAICAVLLFPAYPLMPCYVAILILQALFGLSQGLCWVGAQTFYGQYMRGNAGAAGKLVFFSNGGCFLGPLLLGAVSEHLGIHAGFGFLCGWAALMVLSTLAVPDAVRPASLAGGWRALVPRMADYKSALGLCVMTVVAMVMIFTFIRIANASVQTSFYIVYLGEIQLGETLIGALLGTANFVGTITPPLIQSLERRVPALLVLTVATAATIVFMAVTPLIGAVWLLFIAAAAYGAGVGLGFPTLLAMLSRTIPPDQQGKSVGLRTTVNRLASLVIPVLMGAIAEYFGIRASFFVVGVILLAATAVTTVWVARRVTFR